MIVLEDVSKSFETKTGTVNAVKNANVHVKKGEIHGVIGYSGAGKSTLIRCVNLLERPTSGKIYIEEKEATGQSLERSEEHTSELQSRGHLVCRLLLEKKKK